MIDRRSGTAAMPPRARRLALLAALACGLAAAPVGARAADGDGDTATAQAAAVPGLPLVTTAAARTTVPAFANGIAVGRPVLRTASAETFRPAPMPNEALPLPGAAPADDADQPSLHPDLLKMHDAGATTDSTSSEYDHMARMKPAGGMSLSIPMQ